MKKKRIIILGSNSFVAINVKRKLEKLNVNCVCFTRQNLDLTKNSSISILRKTIKKNDYIFFAAAKAPVKNIDMLIYNLKMLKIISEGIKFSIIKKFIYLSSDAVYQDTKKKITEKTKIAPVSYHGIMHQLREIYLEKIFKNKTCFIRPTLIYGPSDPHNGYGPNLFLRKIKRKKPVTLFGKGEEKRDHIFIDDVSYFISELIVNNFFGKINLATGKVNSFLSIAKVINSLNHKKKKILFIKRNGPMPHLGLRSFNNKKLLSLFPKFRFKSLFVILKKISMEY